MLVFLSSKSNLLVERFQMEYDQRTEKLLIPPARISPLAKIQKMTKPHQEACSRIYDNDNEVNGDVSLYIIIMHENAKYMLNICCIIYANICKMNFSVYPYPSCVVPFLMSCSANGYSIVVHSFMNSMEP